MPCSGHNPHPNPNQLSWGEGRVSRHRRPKGPHSPHRSLSKSPNQGTFDDEVPPLDEGVQPAFRNWGKNLSRILVLKKSLLRSFSFHNGGGESAHSRISLSSMRSSSKLTMKRVLVGHDIAAAFRSVSRLGAARGSRVGDCVELTIVR